MSTEFDACDSLLLGELSEPSTNELQITVLEARATRLPDASSVDAPVPGASPVLHTPGCRIFKLYWTSYIAYSVRNESYAQNGRDIFEGRLFRIFSRSHFLDYVGASTLVTSNYPGPYRHWSLVCLDHVIDVVSTVEPRIEVRIAG